MNCKKNFAKFYNIVKIIIGDILTIYNVLYKNNLNYYCKFL